MAKKQKVNKTQAVRDYLKTHPKAMSGEIAAALTKQGIKINAGHVANIKTQINKARTVKKAAKKKAAVEAAVPAAVETTVKAAATVTLEHVKAVALTTKALGGSTRLYELLGLIKALAHDGDGHLGPLDPPHPFHGLRDGQVLGELVVYFQYLVAGLDPGLIGRGVFNRRDYGE